MCDEHLQKQPTMCDEHLQKQPTMCDEHLQKQPTMCDEHLQKQPTMCDEHLQKQPTMCDEHLQKQPTMCDEHLQKQPTMCDEHLQKQPTMCDEHLQKQPTMCDEHLQKQVKMSHSVSNSAPMYVDFTITSKIIAVYFSELHWETNKASPTGHVCGGHLVRRKVAEEMLHAVEDKRSTFRRVDLVLPLAAATCIKCINIPRLDNNMMFCLLNFSINYQLC